MDGSHHTCLATAFPFPPTNTYEAIMHRCGSDCLGCMGLYGAGWNERPPARAPDLPCSLRTSPSSPTWDSEHCGWSPGLGLLLFSPGNLIFQEGFLLTASIIKLCSQSYFLICSLVVNCLLRFSVSPGPQVWKAS